MTQNNYRHILLAIDSISGRGAEKVVVNLAEALLKLGHKVSIIIYTHIRETKKAYTNIKQFV